jgi:osmotically-inducible protein OsmY
MTAATRTSEDIKRDVVDQLYWDGRVDASNVKVIAADGSVTLTGNVPTYTARQSAQEDAWLIAGVRSVDNRLDVAYSAETGRPEDAELQANVSTASGWAPELQDADIDALVTGGWVTLRGSVNAYWKKLRAEEVTATLAGVRGVTNELSVVPTTAYEDRLIADSIVAALDRNVYVDVESVDVRVNGGVVTLSGSVSSLPAFRAAQETCERTVGVIAVNNELVIR